jgi:hypothetical protein
MMSKNQYAAWSKKFEPVWISGSWLGEEIWNAGLDRLTALGIHQEHVWSIMVSGQDLVLAKGSHDEWSGVLVTYNRWNHLYDLDEVPKLGYQDPCHSPLDYPSK